jgi:hypothetical protein
LVLFMPGANPLDDLPHDVNGPVELLPGRDGVFHSVGLALVDLFGRVPQHRLCLQGLQLLSSVLQRTRAMSRLSSGTVFSTTAASIRIIARSTSAGTVKSTSAERQFGEGHPCFHGRSGSRRQTGVNKLRSSWQRHGRHRPRLRPDGARRVEQAGDRPVNAQETLHLSC